MSGINLSIEASSGKKKRITVEYLGSDASTVTGRDHYIVGNLRRFKEDIVKQGWWFDYIAEDAHNHEVMFADIVNYNGSPIGATTYSTISTAILAAIDAQAIQV